MMWIGRLLHCVQLLYPLVRSLASASWWIIPCLVSKNRSQCAWSAWAETDDSLEFGHNIIPNWHFFVIQLFIMSLNFLICDLVREEVDVSRHWTVGSVQLFQFIFQPPYPFHSKIILGQPPAELSVVQSTLYTTSIIDHDFSPSGKDNRNFIPRVLYRQMP